MSSNSRRADPYRVLLADPAWQYKDALPGGGRGAAKHYSCLPVDAIARFPLPPLADDAWLFLWRVHTHQEEAAFVMRAWGFKYASELVWVKLCNDGTPHGGGMGRTLRMSHEVCLIGKRGRPERLSKAIPSVLMAKLPRFADKQREHSAKPKELYRLIERFADGPRCELFARAPRDGWTSYGNELAEAHP